MDKEILIYTVLSKNPNAEKLNQSDIDKLQKDFNINLPQDYIDFLLKTNGSEINQIIFYYDGIEYELLYFNSIEEIKNLMYGDSYLIPNGTIPIAIVDGNDWIFLSTNKNNLGQIFLGNSNTSIESSLDELILLSDSFNNFLDILIPKN